MAWAASDCCRSSPTSSLAVPGEVTGRWQAEPSSRPSSGTPGLGLLGAVGSAVGAALSDPVSAADAAPRVVRSIGKLLAPATRPLSPVTTARGLDRHLDTLDVPLEDLAAPGERSAAR